MSIYFEQNHFPNTVKNNSKIGWVVAGVIIGGILIYLFTKKNPEELMFSKLHQEPGEKSDVPNKLQDPKSATI